MSSRAWRTGANPLYRAMAWLGDPLPETGQAGRAPPRCVKDLVVEDLFARRRDLFTELDVVSFDTTSIYFEGQGGHSIRRHGLSKDHRPDPGLFWYDTLCPANLKCAVTWEHYAFPALIKLLSKKDLRRNSAWN